MSKAKIYTAEEIAAYQATITMHPRVLAAQRKESRLPPRKIVCTPSELARIRLDHIAELKIENAMLHGEDN